MKNKAFLYPTISAGLFFFALLTSRELMHAQDILHNDNNSQITSLNPQTLVVLLIFSFAFAGAYAAKGIYFFLNEELLEQKNPAGAADSKGVVPTKPHFQ